MRLILAVANVEAEPPRGGPGFVGLVDLGVHLVLLMVRGVRMIERCMSCKVQILFRGSGLGILTARVVVAVVES